MSVYAEQQRRKLNEPEPRDWETTRQAILEARGARECADVQAEEQRTEWERDLKTREVEYAAGQANMTIGQQAEYVFGVLTNDLATRTLVDELYEDKHGL